MPAKLIPGHPGDPIEVAAPGGTPPKRGIIVEVLGREHHEHYLVEWSDGHRSIHYPADGTHVEHHEGGEHA